MSVYIYHLVGCLPFGRFRLDMFVRSRVPYILYVPMYVWSHNVSVYSYGIYYTLATALALTAHIAE